MREARLSCSQVASGELRVARAVTHGPTARGTRNSQPATSRESLELLEVRLPLFHERVPPFLRLFGQIIEERRAAAEIEEAHLAVAIRVHGGFEEAQGHGGEREHLS